MKTSPSDPRHPWARLTRAARSAPVPHAAAAAPAGFSTRVVARSFGEGRLPSFLDYLAPRAVGWAALLAACSLAFNYADLTQGLSGDEGDVLSPDDAVSIVLDLGG
jgi:hypothetical protein